MLFMRYLRILSCFTLSFSDCIPVTFLLDVALVTSLRDGMNLVSYEFVACQDSKKGVLILSEVRLLCFTFTVQFYMFIHQIMPIMEPPVIPPWED